MSGGDQFRNQGGGKDSNDTFGDGNCNENDFPDQKRMRFDRYDDGDFWIDSGFKRI